MSKINQMTMAEIIAEATQRGFDPAPWNHSWYSWNDGIEVASCNFLEKNAPELFEDNEDEED